jgi:uncharacterized protein YodC (DUF2158 family)
MAEDTTSFQPGDVVQLKSGGPLFTVSKISPNGYVLYYYINSQGLISEHNIGVQAGALKKVSADDPAGGGTTW